MWLNVRHMEGLYYVNTICTNPPLWKTWLTATDMHGTENADISVSSANAFTVLGGGKHYITAQKISSTRAGAYPIQITEGPLGNIPNIWISAQKVTGLTKFYNINAGIVDMNVMQWEDGGGVQAGVLLEGGLTTFHGGRMLATNGTAFDLRIGARARIKNMVIDTSTINAAGNIPITVATNGLILDNVTLVAPTLAPSVTAASALSVITYGAQANKTNHGNVTFQVGTFTIDSNVR
jgi:hypothetical protein